MAKHSFKFKKKVVLEYLNGEGGTPYLSTKYGLDLIHNYANGLMHTRNLEIQD